MSRETDVRDFTASRIDPERESQLQSQAATASGLLPGDHQVHVAGLDPVTGNPSLILSTNAPAEQGRFVERALDHVRNLGEAAGLAPSQPVEYQPDPHYQETSSGAVAVHLQQQYKGIGIFDAAQTVRFGPRGELAAVAGRTHTVAEETDVTPTLTAQRAVLRAVEHLAQDDDPTDDPFGQRWDPPELDPTTVQPRIVAGFPDSPTHATVLEAAPLEGPVNAGLLWFNDGDRLRLAWEIVATLPGGSSQFRTLVDAGDGMVVYAKELVRSVRARGNVHTLDGSDERRMIDFPVPWERHGIPVPSDLQSTAPGDWTDESNQTQGNTVHVQQEDGGSGLEGRVEDSVLVLDPPDSEGIAQAVLNAFYYCNLMHDFFYLLGFREKDGNFQADNLGRGGLPGDAVDAHAYEGAVPMTASMLTQVDGTSPTMKLGIYPPTKRHTALDATVVFHEFSHGVTNRLVGGPLDVRALEAPQSVGMGEGWGDYFACTLTKQRVVASWLTGKPGGIRGFPYDTFPAKSENFGSLGTGRYTLPHSIGEIWAATLLAMNREIGDVLGMQLVMDALKLAPANPSFLQMRDAILAALEAKRAAGHLQKAENAQALQGIWKTFATFGMGPKATSNGASLSGIRADFSLPADTASGPSITPDSAGTVAPGADGTAAPRPGITPVPAAAPDHEVIPPPEGIQGPATLDPSAVRNVAITPAAEASTEIRIQFVDERERDDFQVIFRGWLEEYRALADRVRRVRQLASATTTVQPGSRPRGDVAHWQVRIDDL